MQKIFFTFFGFSIFFGGIFIGIIIENFRKSEQKIYDFHATHTEQNKNENSKRESPLLLLEKIENGILHGEIKNAEQSDLRIFLKSDTTTNIQVLQNGKFFLPVEEILPMLQQIPAPKGSKFVASKRGKKYYPLDSPRAFLVSSKNRIFFMSEAEAKEKGFEKFQ